MNIEILRDSEAVEIFIAGATKALDKQGVSTEEKEQIKKTIDIAISFSPIIYFNSLIEIKRRLI